MISLKEYSDADIIFCEAIKTDGTTVIEYISHGQANGTVLSGVQVSKKLLLDLIGSQVWKNIYNIACWANLRFPIGRLYEDIPATFHAFERANKVAFINTPFYKYRVNTDGISLNPKPIKTYHLYLGMKEHYDMHQSIIWILQKYVAQMRRTMRLVHISMLLRMLKQRWNHIWAKSNSF